MRIALIFGGRSNEHEVSVVSARSIRRALNPQYYEVAAMAIDHHGRWADSETATEVLEESTDRTDGVMRFSGTHSIDPRLLAGKIDVVFPVLHGPFGEDGTIQGLCEVLGLPYVGSGVAASAVCMNKILTKRLLTHAAIPTPAWAEVNLQSWKEQRNKMWRRCMKLGLPLFIKPARLGSSVGITKVTESEQLKDAVAEALRFDDQVIVECGVEAREIEVAVLGNENPRASLPGEVVPGGEFYDYADKYVESSCQLLAPAPLEEHDQEAARTIAVDVYKLLGCEGMARVDLFLEASTGAFWVNEVNTIPGFTDISMYPRLWKLTDLPYPELLDELIRLAEDRHENRIAPVPG